LATRIRATSFNTWLPTAWPLESFTLLEAVAVEENHRDGHVKAGHPAQFEHHATFELALIAQAGQIVRDAEGVQPLVRRQELVLQRLHAPQDLQPEDQLEQLERTNDEVVRTALEAPDDLGRHLVRVDREDGHEEVAREHGLDAHQLLEGVVHALLHVDHHDVRPQGLEALPDALAGRRADDRVAAGLERRLEKGELRRIPADDEQSPFFRRHGRSAQQRKPMVGRALPAARLPPALQAASSSAEV
jgi:hypothetical protein